MKADARWADQGIAFWAHVRAIGEALHYGRRDAILTHSIPQMVAALKKMGRPTEALWSNGAATELASGLKAYFDFRSEQLNGQVRADLMVAAEAEIAFTDLIGSTGATVYKENDTSVDYLVSGRVVRVPMNKQKGDKRKPSYLTGLVNLTVAQALQGGSFDPDPRALTSIDHDGSLYAVLSRRMDGCFPTVTNPVAMWEIKEYYYTTTFGSKISDAVYIASLDGYERNELEHATGIHINHVLMVDAYDTWWGKGKSYLCRLIDVLHMGHMDEILFGREVVRRLPELVAEWSAKPPAEPTVGPKVVLRADTLFTSDVQVEVSSSESRSDS